RASADGSKLLGWLAGISDSHLLIWSSPDAPPDDFTFSPASSYAAAASQAASQLQSIEIISQSTIDADPNAIIDTLRPTAISNNRDVVLSDHTSHPLYV